MGALGLAVEECRPHRASAVRKVYDGATEYSMGFGNNPFVAKAQAAEQKAQDANDKNSRERAWRDAGRLWERAAERELDPKRRTAYEQNAERARTEAEAPEGPATLPDPAVLAAHGVTVGTGKPN